MDSLSKLQLNNKLIIEKGRTNFKKSPKDRLTQSYIETRVESLEVQWKQFVDTHRRIIEKATDEELQRNVYFTADTYDLTEELYITYKSELKEHLLQTSLRKSAQPSNNQQSQNGSTSNVKLPQISLPTFSGLYSEWVTFRDLFKSLIHKNDTLDEVQKLHYLKSHLSGEPEQLLRHIPVTASNYNECWSILNKRFDNKRFIIL